MPYKKGTPTSVREKIPGSSSDCHVLLGRDCPLLPAILEGMNTVVGLVREINKAQEMTLELGELEALQWQDETLDNTWQAAKEYREGEAAFPWFKIRNKLLYNVGVRMGSVSPSC